MITNSTPKKDGFRMPAEYEPHAATIMIFPERPGSWPFNAKPAGRVFAGLIRQISECEKVYVVVSKNSRERAKKLIADVGNGGASKERLNGRAGAGGQALAIADPQNIEFLEIPTDDAWARDTAPTFVKADDGRVRCVNWRFNAWGGTVDGLYAHWDRDDALACTFAEKTGYECYDAGDFVLEGGSVHSNGKGTLLVTESCLLSAGRNPQLTKAEIEQKLKDYLGADRVIWLPRGIFNDETNEHVDNVCAFVGENDVVLAWTDDTNDPQYEMSLACLKELERNGVTVHKLPIPAHPVTVTEADLKGYEFEEGEDVREAGERLAASYVNFYFANGAAFVPQFGGENAESDREAIRILQELCPDRRIVPVAAREIILGGGNIHCITQQIPG